MPRVLMLAMIALVVGCAGSTPGRGRSDGRARAGVPSAPALPELDLPAGRLGPPDRTSPHHPGFATAWSPHGRFLAVIGGPSIRVLDGATLALQARIDVEGSPVGELAFSGDEARLAAALGSHTMIYDVRTGQRELELPGEATVAAFAPEGDALAIGGALGLRVWRLAGTLASSRIGDDAAPRMTAVRFGGSGRRLASGHADGTVRLWALPAGRLVRIFTGMARAIEDVQISADGGSIAAVAYEDVAYRRWDIASGRQIAEVREPLGWQPSRDGLRRGRELLEVRWSSYDLHHAVAFSEGAGLVVRQPVVDPEIALFRVSARAPARPRLDESSRKGAGLPRSVAAEGAFSFSPDGKHLAGGCAGPALCVWDTSTGGLRRVLGEGAVAADGFAMDGDGALVVVATGDGFLHHVDLRAGTLTTSTWLLSAGPSRGGGMSTLDGRAPKLAMSSDGRVLAMVIPGEGLYVRDGKSGESPFKLGERGGNFGTLAISRDGRSLLAWSRGDPVVWLWSLDTRTAARLEGCPGAVGHLAFSPEGDRAVATSEREGPQAGSVCVWSLAGGATAGAHVITALAQASADLFSPDGGALAISEEARTVLLDATTLARGRTFADVACGHDGAAFAPDGITIATFGRRAARSCLWDVRSGALVTRFQGGVTSLRFVHGGRGALLATEEGTLALVRMPSGEPLATVGLLDEIRGGYATAPDGSAEILGEDMALAKEAVKCRAGPRLLPFAACQDQVAATGLLKRAFGSLDQR